MATGAAATRVTRVVQTTRCAGAVAKVVETTVQVGRAVVRTRAAQVVGKAASSPRERSRLGWKGSEYWRLGSAFTLPRTKIREGEYVKGLDRCEGLARRFRVHIES